MDAVAQSGGDDPRAAFRRLEIINPRGLHARASAKFVQCAESFNADIIVSKDGQSVCGTSIMGLLMLGASFGCVIEISASGADATEVLAALTQLLESGFGEECQAKACPEPDPG